MKTNLALYNKGTLDFGDNIKILELCFESEDKKKVEAIVSVRSEEDIKTFQKLWDTYFEMVREQGRQEIRDLLSEFAQKLGKSKEAQEFITT